MPGFHFTETMSGSYTRDGKERPFSFQATARAADLLAFFRDRTTSLDGIVDADGLANNSPLSGSLLIDPLLGRVLRYQFDFRGADGKDYHFLGQKDVDPLHPFDTMTTLPGDISDGAGTHCKALLHFHLMQDILGFLASFRLDL